MSSIYRKGRDNYFYYQAYIRDPKTNKKTKKVFHSLGTKDKEEAKRKKIQYDKIYEKPERNKIELSLLKLFFLGAACTFMLYIFVISDSNDSNKVVQREFDVRAIESKTNLNTEKKNLLKILPEIKSESSSDAEAKKKIIGKKKNPLPDYKIIRTEEHSGTFQLGKIYVTISSSSLDKEILRSLCQKIKDNHKSYSSVIICIYKDDDIGRELASGKIEFSGTVDQISSWIVMYSYNSVEGEFFNDNPSAHLG